MPILVNVTDDEGRPVKTTNRPRTESVFHNRVEDRRAEMQEAWTPAEIAAALRDAEDGRLSRQIDLFEQMEEKDGALAGLMQTRRLAPAGLKWTILPRNDTPRAKRAANVARETIEGVPGFRWGLIDLCDAIGKGISVEEIDWTRDASVLGLRHIHPKRIIFDDETDEVRILRDEESQTATFGKEGIIPDPFKVLIHKTKMRTTHPARGGILRVVTWAYLLRNYTLKDWVTFSEIFGMPLRVAKYPLGAGDAEKAALMEAVRMLGSDAAAVISEQTQLEIREAANRGQQPYSALADAMRSEMALAILGQELTNLDSEGSRALGQVHNQVRRDLLQADCEDLQETITQGLILPIIGWKIGWDIAQTLCPRFKFHYEAPIDYKTQAEVDKLVFIDMGLGKHVTVGYVASRYGIQLAEGVDPEEKLVDEAALAAATGTDSRGTSQRNPNRENDRDQATTPPQEQDQANAN